MKEKLGANNPHVNAKVKSIVEAMERLKTTINNNIGDNIFSTFSVNGIDTYSGKNPRYKMNNGEGIFKNVETETDTDAIDLTTLDNKGYGNTRKGHVEKMYTIKSYSPNFNMNNNVVKTEFGKYFEKNGDRQEVDPTEIENRLYNCQSLEYLYLKKHDEVITIFTFVLNLFDKYKYQGELLLYLLKYLVYPPKSVITPPRPGPGNKVPCTGPVSVRIPKPIIINIQKLIKDQDKIQKIISTMKESIDNSPHIPGVPGPQHQTDVINSTAQTTTPTTEPVTAKRFVGGIATTH